MGNPLIECTGLPAFGEIDAADVIPAIKQVLSENRTRLENRLVAETEVSWENLAELSAELDERLEQVWSPVRHLAAVRSSRDMRDAYNESLQLISDYETELSHNQILFALWQELDSQADGLSLDSAQRKLIREVVRDFRLSGVDLDSENKKQFGALQKRLSVLQAQFEENVLDATDSWYLEITDPAELTGMSASSLERAKARAEKAGREGYRLTLDYPSYDAVISYCDNRDLRQQIYTAYTTKASSGNGDNTPVMCEILGARAQIAKILGYGSYADQSLLTKMAGSTDRVIRFLGELSEKTRPVAERELQELEDFARQSLGMEKLESWDFAYVTQKLRAQVFSFTDEQIKEYFPVEQVLKGLFELVNELFGITVSRSSTAPEVWHEDVMFFEVKDITGQMIAQFYLDLYARKHKRGGAWMDECRSYRVADGRHQRPVAYLVCNSSPPVGNRPALLTHDEVVTLFHEFGHGLQHMLTRVPYLQLSGIRGVEWDAVELPSQFMENWCWRDEILERISRHYETGAPLPERLRDALRASRTFQAGMQMLRQIEFSLIDMHLHMEKSGLDGKDIRRIINRIRDEIAVVRPPGFNRFENGFTHIFGGGYSAGYYSYKWAEVLSSDAFSKFEEEGLFNRETGKAFLNNILEMGGAEPAMTLFERFRGREPNTDALLRHNGITV